MDGDGHNRRDRCWIEGKRLMARCRSDGRRDRFLAFNRCRAGDDGAGAAVRRLDHRNGANRRGAQRELAQRAGQRVCVDGLSAELEIVRDRKRGQPRVFADVPFDASFEDAALDHGLDADDDGDRKRDQQGQTRSHRQRPAQHRHAGARLRAGRRRQRGAGIHRSRCSKRAFCHCTDALSGWHPDCVHG